MARDPEIIDGIKLWLTARQQEALYNHNKEIYRSLEILQVDLARSKTTDEYPWEVITRVYNKRLEEGIKRNETQKTTDSNAETPPKTSES